MVSKARLWNRPLPRPTAQRHNVNRMPASFQELVDYFHSLATEDVTHTDGTYMGHCFSVYRDMKKWGFDEDLARAGLFHSIYGTELFDRFKLDVEKRSEIRDLIGERAERLAYINCSNVSKFKQIISISKHTLFYDTTTLTEPLIS